MNKVITSLMLFMPMAASAQEFDDWGMNRMDGVNLGTNSLGGTIAGIINVVLSFLGIIATVIILLGGFKWMTSQGNSDKVDEAKKLLGAGVIGLAIVVSAYALSRFILGRMFEETTGGDSGVGDL